MYLVGQTVTDVALTTRSATDVLEPDAAVVFTVTKPDATTATPATSNPSTGVYQALYVTTMAGLHTWSATTASHGPQSGSFNVSADTGIVSLADVKAHLNKTDTTDDEELRGAILAATQWVEGRIGAVARRTVTEIARPDRDGFLYLNHPVISLTTLVGAYGTTGLTYVAATVTAQSPELATGKVWLGLSSWSCGPLLVTYVAGRTVVPDQVQWAAKEYVAWLWDTQRGPAQSSALNADLGDLGAGLSTVPRRIVAALEPYTVPAVA